MTTIRDVNPDTVGDELVVDTRALVARMADAPITSTADLELAVADRAALGDQIKRVEAFFAPIKKLAYDLHKAICVRESAILVPLHRVDVARSIAMSDYKAACDRARAAREQAIADQQHRDDQARAASEAAALEAAGHHDVAAAVIDEAISRPAPAVSLPDETKQVEGLRFRRRWCWRYVGGPKDVATTPPAVLSRALAILPREYLSVDEKRIGSVVRAMKHATKIPGIEVFPVDDPIR